MGEEAGDCLNDRGERALLLPAAAAEVGEEAGEGDGDGEGAAPVTAAEDVPAPEEEEEGEAAGAAAFVVVAVVVVAVPPVVFCACAAACCAAVCVSCCVDPENLCSFMEVTSLILTSPDPHESTPVSQFNFTNFALGKPYLLCFTRRLPWEDCKKKMAESSST